MLIICLILVSPCSSSDSSAYSFIRFFFVSLSSLLRLLRPGIFSLRAFSEAVFVDVGFACLSIQSLIVLLLSLPCFFVSSLFCSRLAKTQDGLETFQDSSEKVKDSQKTNPR